MAKIDNTKLIKVIISKRVDDKEILDSIDKVETVKQGGVIMNNGKHESKLYTVKIGATVELPENIVEYIKDRKSYRKTGNGFELTPIYLVEKVGA